MLVVEPHGSDRALAGTELEREARGVASVEVGPVAPWATSSERASAVTCYRVRVNTAVLRQSELGALERGV
jgi:hypothetical protein